MKGLQKMRHRLLLARFAGGGKLRLRIAQLLLLMMGFAAFGGGGSSEFAEMKCSNYKKPLVRCESLHIFPPNKAAWGVYSAGALREYDEGKVVYLTVPPSGELALLEMSFMAAGGNKGRASTLVRWRDGNILFFEYKGAEDCGNFKPCA